MVNSGKLSFVSDYMEGCAPEILQRLAETNLVQSAGYGLDQFSDAAKEKIRLACGDPEAEIFFLVGGTQTNATVIDSLLRPWQGVIAAESGHVSTHEAGAIEWGGHKVLTLPAREGKLSADSVAACLRAYREDENRDHLVMPGLVYISQPTEYGTLYSLAELEALSALCREYQVPLYLDGARLAYGLACPQNDVSLREIARLCDAFYIGGTKCGALFGEAVVFPRHGAPDHFFSMVKQHGALLAKGRIAGIQFETLFTDGLYERLGQNAIQAAIRIREALESLGYQQYIVSPTNQVFVLLDQAEKELLTSQVEMGFMERTPEGAYVMRFATSWATQPQDVDSLISVLEKAKG